MKFATRLFVLAACVFAVAYTQCDTDDQNLFGAWATYQDTGDFNFPLWEEEELMAWGMDGNNKWNDYWMRRQFNTITGTYEDSHYARATCQTTSQGAIPQYQSMCGDCSITAISAQCECYPYYDVAESYQESPKPTGGQSASETPEGWTSAYEIGNPPFETLDSGPGAWTLNNCIKYKPEWVYYYTQRMKLGDKNVRNTVTSAIYELSYGISNAFEPTDEAWEEFCELLHEQPPVTYPCPVPSKVGSRGSASMKGAHYQYQSGTWREDFISRAQFYTDRFESGCHPKSRNHRWPSANYCGGPSGWQFGAGVVGHVHFGCDVTTFFDTETDFDREIDDEDCSSVYLLFDEMNGLDVTVDEYDQLHWVEFQRMATSIRDQNCWYRSKFIDHRSDTPSYRTPCAGSQTVVSMFAVFAAVLFGILRNLF